MSEPTKLILGEFRRTMDERFRLSIPTELLEVMMGPGGECILAKERPGALSLWPTEVWNERLAASVGLVEAKIRAGRLSGRIDDVQHLGRLLSTRHRPIQLAGRGRILIPEGFREFLQVEVGGEVLIVGAAVCIEIWKPEAWISYLQGNLPEFGKLLNDLSA